MNKKLKRRRDGNELAKSIVDIATGEKHDDRVFDGKDPAAVSLGRRGGLSGDAARALKLTAEQRSEIARAAAKARWSKD